MSPQRSKQNSTSPNFRGIVCWWKLFPKLFFSVLAAWVSWTCSSWLCQRVQLVFTLVSLLKGLFLFSCHVELGKHNNIRESEKNITTDCQEQRLALQAWPWHQRALHFFFLPSHFEHTMKVKLSWPLRDEGTEKQKKNTGKNKQPVKFGLNFYNTKPWTFSLRCSLFERANGEDATSTSFSWTHSSCGWQMKCQSKGIFCYFFFNFFLLVHFFPFPGERNEISASGPNGRRTDAKTSLQRNNFIRDRQLGEEAKTESQNQLNKSELFVLFIRSLSGHWSNQEVRNVQWKSLQLPRKFFPNRNYYGSSTTGITVGQTDIGSRYTKETWSSPDNQV